MKKLPYLITTFILCVFVMNSNAQFDCFKSADGNSINFGAGSAPAGPASQIEITINGTSFKACKSGVIVNPNGSGSIHIALDDCFNDNTTNYRCRVVQTCTKNCPISTNPPPVTGGTGIKKACWKKNVGGVKRFEMYQMENTNLKDQIIRVTDGTSFSGCLFDVDFTNGTGFGQLSETQYQCFPNSNNFQCEIVSSCSGGCTEGANPNPPPTNPPPVTGGTGIKKACWKKNVGGVKRFEMYQMENTNLKDQIIRVTDGTSFSGCLFDVDFTNGTGFGQLSETQYQCFPNSNNFQCEIVSSCSGGCTEGANPNPPPTNPPPVTGGTGIKKACWKKNVGGVKRFEMYQMENTNLKDQIIRVTDGTSFSGCLFDVDFTNGTGFGQLSETQYQCFPNSNNFQCEIVSSCSGGCTEGANPNPPPTNGNISVLKDYPTPEQDPTCGMYIGAAATTLYQDHEETNYLETFKDNFNMVVPEVGMKMDFLKPDGTFNPNNFALQAEVDGLAGKNTDDLIVRGHTISWHGGKKMIKDNQPNHCFNNVQDGNETGKNCGGSCAPCHCFNKIQDGNEQRIDCGGSCVPCRDSNNPNYLKGMTNSQLENELRGYIAQMMNSMNSKYKIESWDVVNEAFRGIDPNSPHGPFRTFAEIQGDVSFHGGVEDNRNFNGAANGIPCIWEKLGYSNIEFEVFGTRHKIPNYIIIAFQEAAKHRLPGQALVYNDWGAEILGVYGNKAEYQFQMIKKLRTINTPEGQPIIDGVGFQCHFDVDFENPNALPAHRGPSPNRIDQNRINQFGTVINKYTSDPITQNMKIYFSEVDIALPIERTNQDRINQKEAYRLLVDFAASIPQTEAFVTWGLADDFSWIGANKEPLLFKKKFKNNNQFEKFEAKAAYFEALNALKAASCNTNKLIGYFDNEVEPIFTAYPNPFDQTIQIDLEEGNGEMKIYDMTGRTMLSQSINSNQTNVNTERLKAGYYLIEVESNGETQTQKIIKH